MRAGRERRSVRTAASEEFGGRCGLYQQGRFFNGSGGRVGGGRFRGRSGRAGASGGLRLGDRQCIAAGVKRQHEGERPGPYPRGHSFNDSRNLARHTQPVRYVSSWARPQEPPQRQIGLANRPDRASFILGCVNPRTQLFCAHLHRKMRIAWQAWGRLWVEISGRTLAHRGPFPSLEAHVYRSDRPPDAGPFTDGHFPFAGAANSLPNGQSHRLCRQKVIWLPVRAYGSGSAINSII